jgi:hypothetical protein
LRFEETNFIFRSNIFFRFSIGILLLNILGSEVGASLLGKSVYLSIKIFLPLSFLVFPVLYVMPETLYLRKTGSDILIQEPEAATVGADIAALSHAQSVKAAFQNFKDRAHQLRREYTANMKLTTKIFSQDSNILLCCFALFVCQLEYFVMVIYVNQFMSKKFLYSLAQSAFISPIYDAFKILVLFTLPFLVKYLRENQGLSPPVTDLLLARWSLLLIAIGSGIIAFSPEIVTFIIGKPVQLLSHSKFDSDLHQTGLFVVSLGTGATSVLRSVVTSRVSKHQYAALYSGLNVVQTLAMLVAGPLFANTFSAGLNIGFIGLPFLVLGTAQILAAITLLFVRLEARTKMGRSVSPPAYTEDGHVEAQSP